MSYEILNRLMDSWQDLREIVVYGFGKVAILAVEAAKERGFDVYGSVPPDTVFVKSMGVSRI